MKSLLPIVTLVVLASACGGGGAGSGGPAGVAPRDRGALTDPDTAADDSCARCEGQSGPSSAARTNDANDARGEGLEGSQPDANAATAADATPTPKPIATPCTGCGALTSITRCAGAISGSGALNSENGTEDYRYSYEAAVNASGDVFVFASISNIAFQASSGGAYLARSPDVLSAPVRIQDDYVGNFNRGTWTLAVNRFMRSPTISYADPDISGGVKTWALPASHCTATHSDR